jgi:hypothetical protein
MAEVPRRSSRLPDLKPENILVGLECLSVLDNVAKTEVAEPSPRKVLHDWIIYLSRNDFGPPKSSPGKPMITDSGSATFGNTLLPDTLYSTQSIPLPGSYFGCTLVI